MTTELVRLDELTDRVFPPGTQKRRQYDKYMRRMRARRAVVERLFGWMRRIPLVGVVVYVWWSALVDEGLDGAVDAMCFSFLDDRNPTARWHSWYRHPGVLPHEVNRIHPSATNILLALLEDRP